MRSKQSDFRQLCQNLMSDRHRHKNRQLKMKRHTHTVHTHSHTHMETVTEGITRGKKKAESV